MRLAGQADRQQYSCQRGISTASTTYLAPTPGAGEGIGTQVSSSTEAEGGISYEHNVGAEECTSANEVLCAGPGSGLNSIGRRFDGPCVSMTCPDGVDEMVEAVASKKCWTSVESGTDRQSKSVAT